MFTYVLCSLIHKVVVCIFLCVHFLYKLLFLIKEKVVTPLSDILFPCFFTSNTLRVSKVYWIIIYYIKVYIKVFTGIDTVSSSNLVGCLDWHISPWSFLALIKTKFVFSPLDICRSKALGTLICTYRAAHISFTLLRFKLCHWPSYFSFLIDIFSSSSTCLHKLSPQHGVIKPLKWQIAP